MCCTASLLLVINSMLAQDNWMQKSGFPASARKGSVGFSIGDKGYIGTGQDVTGYRNDFWSYEPAADSWTQKADFAGGAREGATAFNIGGKGYIGMGMNPGLLNDFWEYDPLINSWTKKADFAGGARFGSVGISIGSKGYVGTGDNFYGYLRDFWEYDPVSDSWTQKADFGGPARVYAAGFSVAGKGYIGTGLTAQNYYDNTLRKDFSAYDPATNSWAPINIFPGAGRYGATAFTIGNKGYVGTGWGPEGLPPFKQDIWEYNSSDNNWSQKLNLSGSGREYASGFSIDGKGYIALGEVNNDSLKDVWEYTPAAVVPDKPMVSFDPTAVTTLAGSGVEGFADGRGLAAVFNHPGFVSGPDAGGRIYVSDGYNARIRRIDPDGTVITFAGNGVCGLADGAGTSAQLCSPNGIALDATGNIYVADENKFSIRKITPAGVVSTLAGNGTSGSENGTGTAARFADPRGVAVDAAGNIYVADTYNRQIRKITPAGMVSTFASNGDQPTGLGAPFYDPVNLAFDPLGNLYVIQVYSGMLRISPEGYLSTFITDALKGFPQGLAIDKTGNIYVSVTSGSSVNNCIYRLSPAGRAAIIAGTMNGFSDTAGREFSFVAGLSVDDSGNVYVADKGNNRIRKVSKPNLYLTTNAGAPSAAKYFTISANYVHDAVLLRVPRGFEVAKNETGPWADMMSIDPVAGEINVFKIYIRLKADAAAGVYKDSLELSAIGAARQKLLIAGLVRDTTPPTIACVQAQAFCFNNTHQYTIPLLVATDPSYIREVKYSISGTTNRSGAGDNASGLFNPGKSVITWTAFDWWNNSSSCETPVIVDMPLKSAVPDVHPLLIWGQVNTLYIGFGAASVTLTANASGGIPLPGGNYGYAWSNGAGSKSISVSPSASGTYNYIVAITDSLGCRATVTKTIKVVDVRCGPKMNRVLVCWPNRHGNIESCVNQNQALLALLLGAKPGSCGNGAQRSMEPSVTEVSKGISIFPNPNNGSFVLQLKQLNKVEIRILDQSGRLVLRQSVKCSNSVQNLVMDIGRVANGLYLVQAIGNDAVYTAKMLVQQ